LVNWLTGAKSLPDILTKGWDWLTGAPAGGLGPLTSGEWTNLVSQLGPISDAGDLMLGGMFPLAGSPGAGAGAAAAGGGNWTPELMNAIYGGGSTGAGSGASGAGALSGLGGAAVGTGAIAALAYLLSPQMSPIPGMRDKSDEINANEARQYAQRLMTYSPEQLERDVIQPAANGDPSINGMAIEMLPSPQYDAFKARYRAARDHTGEFAGHPSLSYPTQNDVRVQEALEGLKLQGITLTPEQYAWANVPDTGR